MYIITHLREKENIWLKRQTRKFLGGRRGKNEKVGKRKEEERGKRGRKKEGRKKKIGESFYLRGRQRKWLYTARDEGAQRPRSERPGEKNLRGSKFHHRKFHRNGAQIRFLDSRACMSFDWVGLLDPSVLMCNCPNVQFLSFDWARTSNNSSPKPSSKVIRKKQ